jgi:hypothetical protein
MTSLLDRLYLRLAANDSSSLTIQLPVKDIHSNIVGRLVAVDSGEFSKR